MAFTFNKCPSYGANLNVEAENDHIFCQYCGARIEGNSNHVVFEHVEHIVDDAEILKVEAAKKSIEGLRKRRLRGLIGVAITGIAGVLIKQFASEDNFLFTMLAYGLIVTSLRLFIPLVMAVGSDAFRGKHEYLDDLEKEISRLSANEAKKKKEAK